MGLDINAVKFLIDARRRGVEFGDVLTFGRQDLNVYPARMAALLEAHGFPADRFKTSDPALTAEPCFLSLGAKKVESMDVSAFEGASFLHDLNQPVGRELHQHFDLVYDGGTLEHVFNFPTALRNCMEMVKVGGRFVTHTIANNWCGHGFYQFSPELFYRALSEENGFEVERMVALHPSPFTSWYEVSDPEQVRARVVCPSLLPIMLLVQARRLKSVPIFSRFPQQSDYTPRWKNDDPSEPQAEPKANPYAPARPPLSRSLPGVARLFHVIRYGFAYVAQFRWDRRHFRRVSKP